MKKLATLTAVLAAVGALGAMGAPSPAMAAMGQCFDAYGRPAGPPHNTDNPPYGMICNVYRQGGQCTHVQPGWAESNCGIAPRYRRQYEYNPRYNYNRYDGNERQRRRQERDDARRIYENKYHPKQLAPGLQHKDPNAMAPNDSR
jgi:hypothetical protein